MNLLSRSLFAVACVAACIAPAAAQQSVRAFPQNTLRGTMAFGAYPEVTLNGRAMQLSPGSRVRNPDNMIVMAATLAGTRHRVHYTLDLGGAQIRDVWILRPEEAAKRPWPRTVEEAQSWTYDPTTQTWTEP